MKNTLLVPAIVILALVSTVAPLSAHHSWPVNMSQLVTVKGTVIEFTWANPHPMITLEVRTNDGKTEKWLVGGPATNRMEANGWTRTTVKPGDVITGIGYQFADGQKCVDGQAQESSPQSTLETVQTHREVIHEIVAKRKRRNRERRRWEFWRAAG